MKWLLSKIPGVSGLWQKPGFTTGGNVDFSGKAQWLAPDGWVQPQAVQCCWVSVTVDKSPSPLKTNAPSFTTDLDESAKGHQHLFGLASRYTHQCTPASCLLVAKQMSSKTLASFTSDSPNTQSPTWNEDTQSFVTHVEHWHNNSSRVYHCLWLASSPPLLLSFKHRGCSPLAEQRLSGWNLNR